MGRKDKPSGWWSEDGKPAGYGKAGRAGRGPRRKDKEGNPPGWGLRSSGRGPTRGTSSTGHDRRGGWFFGRGSR
jgi:hypothetical protein